MRKWSQRRKSWGYERQEKKPFRATQYSTKFLQGPGTLYVQTTSDQTGGNSGERIRKIAGLPAARLCIDGTGNRLHVHAWKKRGPRGGAKFWTVKVVEITFDEDGLLQTKVLPGTDVVEEEETGQKVIGFDKEEF